MPTNRPYTIAYHSLGPSGGPKTMLWRVKYKFGPWALLRLAHYITFAALILLVTSGGDRTYCGVSLPPAYQSQASHMASSYSMLPFHPCLWSNQARLNSGKTHSLTFTTPIPTDWRLCVRWFSWMTGWVVRDRWTKPKQLTVITLKKGGERKEGTIILMNKAVWNKKTKLCRQHRGLHTRAAVINLFIILNLQNEK